MKHEREICMGVYNGDPNTHTDRTRIFYRTGEMKHAF